MSTVVVGGGLVGSAIAYGLALQGETVTILDEGDVAFRASRGNFGLVWVQGKGDQHVQYASWSLQSARLWPRLATDLQRDAGIDVCLQQPGGYHICLSDDEMQERANKLSRIRENLDQPYDYQIYTASELKRILPEIGPDVVGASHTPYDGHVNPLLLLRALHKAAIVRGAAYRPNRKVLQIKHSGSSFRLETDSGDSFTTDKLVIAAGLSNRELAEQVDIYVPIKANQGQVLIGERCKHFLSAPTTYIRQTNEGTIQMGDSMADMGLDDRTQNEVISTIARRAIRTFPILGTLNLVRAWAALRIMSPDGLPIYQESRACPGAYVFTCHSGVTLAANHAYEISRWVFEGEQPDAARTFSNARFMEHSSS